MSEMQQQPKTIDETVREVFSQINDNNTKMLTFIESVKDYNMSNLRLVDNLIGGLMQEIKSLSEKLAEASTEKAAE